MLLAHIHRHPGCTCLLAEQPITIRCRNYTGRQYIISFDGAFHGRTYGAMALTSSKSVYRQTFGPLMASVAVAPFPYCLRCPTRQAAGGLGYQVRAMSGDSRCRAKKLCIIGSSTSCMTTQR